MYMTGGYDLSAFHFSRHLRDDINIRRRTGMRRRETEEGKRKEGLVVPNEIQRIKKRSSSSSTSFVSMFMFNVFKMTPCYSNIEIVHSEITMKTIDYTGGRC